MTTKKYASINDLPNELLLIIFKLLYGMSQKHECSAPKEPWVEDPFSPPTGTFPFAQANVCQRWRTLLASYPTFWTHVVVVPNATPLHDVTKYFSWSQGPPVDVVVKSDPSMPLQAPSPDEKSYVHALLPYISHHLDRIRTIEFSVLHYPSIPDVGQWLVRPANFLTSIKLAHAGHLVYPPSLHRNPNNQADIDWLGFCSSVPELTTLSIDWRTFARACRSNRAWLKGVPKLQNLSLTPSGTCSPLEHLSVEATVEALSHARPFGSITLQSIPFVSDYIVSPHHFYVDSMEFEDLRGIDLGRFLHGVRADCRPEYMTIKNCSLGGLNNVVARELRLENLNEGDLTDLIDDLCSFDLYLDNCPAFNDTVLDLMTEAGSDGVHFPAGALSALTLARCTNFSVECLYRMVHARRMAVEASPFWDGTEDGLIPDHPDAPTAFTSLIVTGGPFLSGEYRTRFGQLVPVFSWTSAELVAGDVVNN